MSESIIAKQLDYKKVDYSHPTYIHSRITQLTGGTTATLAGTGGEESLFELPANTAFNLARTCANFTYQLAAEANKRGRSHAWGTCAPIEQIQLYTRDGIYLADVRKANN